MKKIIRLFCLVFSCLLVLGVFASCGGNRNNTEHEKETIPQDVDALNPNIEAIDGQGNEFNVLTRTGGESYIFPYSEISVTDDMSNLVNRALVTRNDIIETKYNVVLSAKNMSSGKMVDKMENDYKSELHMYDLMMPMLDTAFTAAVKGILVEWDLIDYVDIEKEYWMKNVYTATTIGGYQFFAPGAANISAYETVPVVFFNKSLITTYGLDSPYDYVNNGDWTMETFATLCTDATQDNDGVLGMTPDDSYGLCINAFAWQPLFYSSGNFLVSKDTSDVPYLTFGQSKTDSEKILTLMSNIVAFANDKSKVLLTNNYSSPDASANLETYKFVNNQSLFWIEAVYGQVNVANMDNPYGILPIPVWNKGDDFTSYIHASHSSVTCLSKMAYDKKLSAAIMEDMAYYSNKIVIPEFYENTIMIKNVRDDESYAMLKKVYSNVVVDLGIVMKSAGLTIDNELRSALIDNSTTLASTLQGNVSNYNYYVNGFATIFSQNGYNQYQ